MNDFELLIQQSIQIVMEKLCEWVWDIFEWTDSRMSNRLSPSQMSGIPIQEEIMHYRALTKNLMSWIGWDLWEGCEKPCAWNELCYTPMWPVIYSPGKHQGGIYAGAILTEEEMLEFWTPKCITREDFDCGGGRAREPQYQLPDVPYQECKSLQLG